MKRIYFVPVLEKKKGADQKGRDNHPAPNEPRNAYRVFFSREFSCHVKLLAARQSTHLEYRHVHGHDYEADGCAQKDHEHGFKHGRERGNR